MKSILILFVIFTTASNVFALPQSERDDIHRAMDQLFDKCFKQNGLDPSTVTDEKMESDDPEIKCFHGCMAKGTNLMNNDGTVNKQKLFTFPPNMPEDVKQHLMSSLAPCAELKGSNECETGFLLFKCMNSGQRPN